MPIRLAQLTDCHLFDDPKTMIREVNSWQSFQGVVERLKQNCQTYPLDLLLLTGDLAHECKTSEPYLRIVESLAEFTCPIGWVPGNHDTPTLLSSTFSKAFGSDKIFDMGNWRIILLNSQWEGQIAGKLSTSQWDFLEKSLQDNPQEHVFLTIHHNLVDALPMKNDFKFINSEVKKLFELVKPFNVVRGITSGHCHSETEFSVHGIRCFTTPSTCVQFTVVEDCLASDPLEPGYRWLNLHKDGQIETEVIRVD